MKIFTTKNELLKAKIEKNKSLLLDWLSTSPNSFEIYPVTNGVVEISIHTIIENKVITSKFKGATLQEALASAILESEVPK